MRLINVSTMQIEELFGDHIPPYAILSHCWGEGEVSFQDFNGSERKNSRKKLGRIKIEYGCSQAKIDELSYLWVDTCCIDKSSSAELSEAINSMYNWYAQSKTCYAYLEDVDEVSTNLEYTANVREFSISRWFTRGWTLQELIAPGEVKLFGLNWKYLGTKRDLSETISRITTIPDEILRPLVWIADKRERLSTVSVAKRVSWASVRQTNRVEDVAYCLLGIFDINMPLLYGEGEKAFVRLQEEIIKQSEDQSIFAWQSGEVRVEGLFATHPSEFRKSSDLVPIPSKAETSPYTMTNRGLHIQIFLLHLDTERTTIRLTRLSQGT